MLTAKRIGNGVAQVAAGYSHAALVGTGGGLFGWGAAYAVGNGTRDTVREPVRIGSGYTSVAAGGEHSLAITTDGRVMAWGDSSYGQIGDADPTAATTLSPVAVLGLNK